MSDQGMNLEKLMRQFEKKVSVLKLLINMVASGLLVSWGCFGRDPISTSMAYLIPELVVSVIPNISVDDYNQLARVKDRRLQCWETAQRIAEICNVWISRIVNHTDVQVEPLLLEEWLSIKHILERVSNSICNTLTLFECSNLSHSLREVYITQARATDKLLAEMWVQMCEPGRKTLKHLESRKDHS
jgi:hypothetical protein